MSEEAQPANEAPQSAETPKKERKKVAAWFKSDGSKRRPSEKMHNAIMAVLARKRAGLQPDYKTIGKKYGFKVPYLQRMVFAAEHGEIDISPPRQVEDVKREDVRASYEVTITHIGIYEALVLELFAQKLDLARKDLKGKCLNFETLEALGLPKIRAELKRIQDHKSSVEKATLANLIALLEAEARRKHGEKQPTNQVNIQNNVTVNQGAGAGGLPESVRQSIPSAGSVVFANADALIEAAFREANQNHEKFVISETVKEAADTE